MIRNYLYYAAKPTIPLRLRRSVRRWAAVRTRARFRDKWPILPGSERPPAGWPGWPGGKKSAFVITHDVESQTGADKSLRLMELERKYGFCSSFNFIPEGNYRVSRELRDELSRNGAEIGVHDLHHDGKLYQNRRGFAQKAASINKYLKEWGAVGFRSGFMFHNLEWLHDLDIKYDASTFDVDPFEPQPDPMATIFPFWHAGANGNGFVELPYTLPQDSTLFLLFNESTPQTWIEKLDWIVSHGGMALVNVHPDYIRFEGEPASFENFPVQIYEQFLQYVQSKYGALLWNPLPRDMAAFVAPLRLALPPKRRRVCMVTYSDYLGDSRVMRYAEALAERGDAVEVFSVGRDANLAKEGSHNKVNIVRVQSRRRKSERTPFAYMGPLTGFLIRCSFLIFRKHRREPYDLVHIHNMPDFLVFAALYPKLGGAKIILDIHDIVPEFYVSKFNLAPHQASVRILTWLERVSARIAHHVIISNHLWLERYSTRTGANGKCSVFINNVDSGVFYSRPRTRSDDKFIIIFPGSLEWHQGVDIAVRAFVQVSAAVPSAEFHIYGDGKMRDQLKSLAVQLGIDDRVRFFDPVSVQKIAGIMANADLGVVPKRADSFGNEAYSTKIMELMSVGVPVVISSTKIDRYYFNESLVRFFPSGDHDALAAAMLQVISDKTLRERMVASAFGFVAENSWDKRKKDYLKLVDSL